VQTLLALREPKMALWVGLLCYVLLHSCNAFYMAAVSYQQGGNVHKERIQAKVLSLAMNPLFIDPKNFIVAHEPGEDAAMTRLVGFGQIRPVNDDHYELAR
jgi:hypothetical protein